MLSPDEIAGLPVEEYGFPGPLRDALVDAILDGRKTSTTSLVVWHSPLRDPTFAVSDSTEVVLVRFCVPVQH